jgi:hypothetical protein
VLRDALIGMVRDGGSVRATVENVVVAAVGCGGGYLHRRLRRIESMARGKGDVKIGVIGYWVKGAECRPMRSFCILRRTRIDCKYGDMYPSAGRETRVPGAPERPS